MNDILFDTPTAHALQEAKRSAHLQLVDNAYLRPLVEADVSQAYIDGLNDPVVHKYLVLVRRPPQTRESVEAYVRSNREKLSDILFGLFIDNGLKGTVRLHDIDLENHEEAYIGITLFDVNYWGKGWGWRAISAVASFGQHSLGIDRILAGIYPCNTISQRAFFKADFHRTQERGEDDFGVFELWVREN